MVLAWRPEAASTMLPPHVTRRHSLWVVWSRPHLCPLPRSGMGRPGSRRPYAVRVLDPRRCPGRPQLDHDPQETRSAYRQAFAGFDAERVARFNARKVEQLLGNPGIVRNRLKVESAVKNARAFRRVQDEFGSFAVYQWRFVDGRPRQNRPRALKDIPAKTDESDALSKDLKRRGFAFVGSTIIYAHMQAVGMVNDHVVDCFRRREVARMAATRA